MAVVALEADNFDQAVSENNIVFLDFWAEWCVPCKAFGEIFEKVADKNPDIKFFKINIQQQPQLASDFNVMSIPHLIVLKDSIAIFSDSGALPLKALQDLVVQARQADVSEIKNKIANEE